MLPCIGSLAAYLCRKMKTTMTKKQRQELVRLEKQIVKTARYVEGHGLVEPMSAWDGTTREEVAELLKERQARLNEMLLCTEQEVSDFKKVNDRLYALTQKMHEKALSLYRAILKEGYDRDFDDDIMVEGTVKYVFNDAWGSVVLTGEERRNMYEKPLEPYWSDFPAMLEILYEYYENTLEPECASCFASYELFHKPDMDPKEFGLENFLDDGQSWAEGLFDREEFKDICICHAVHELCQHKMYSIPDLLRMNDFWCEVRVTHQLLSDRDGKRYSCIERKGEE